MMKIAVFLPNWLGDATMATPALRSLRHHFGPEAKIVGIVRPNLADLLAGSPWLDEQWYFRPKARQWELRSLPLAFRMRRERFDLAIMLTNSLRPAVISWLAGVERRVGYARNGRGPLLTTKLSPIERSGRRAAVPMVDYYLRLAEAVGCSPESPRLELNTTPADEQAADDVWKAHGLRRDGRVVLINAGGAYGDSKRWPAENFGDLARQIAKAADHDVLVVCGPSERQLARDIEIRASHPRVFSLANHDVGLGLNKACVRRGRVMVSNDSGPRHMAAAFGKPVVTLYGPFLPIWSENPTVEAVNLIRDDLECIGCHKRTCPLGHHKCMRHISVDMVYRAVAGILEKESARAAA